MKQVNLWKTYWEKKWDFKEAYHKVYKSLHNSNFIDLIELPLERSVIGQLEVRNERS
jgi:hypothetical protein